MPEVSRSTTDDISRDQRVSTTYIWNILFEDISREWISFKPSLGIHVYVCYACRHMFSSLRSLQDHVNRRIILINYKCAKCPTENLTFYNRCSFLLHARSHFNLNQGLIDLSNIEISPLPIDLAGFLPHENITPLYNDEDDTTPNGHYINAQFYSPDAKHKGKSLIPLAPNDLLFKQNSSILGLKQVCKNIPKCEFITAEDQTQLKNRGSFDREIKTEPSDYTLPIISKVESLRDTNNLPRCLDCDTYQEGPLAEHYLGDNKPTNSALSCLVCKFVASTVCSLRAHVRIHSATAPFVCPDCGKDFDSFRLLTAHMEEVCFHLSKSVRYRCPGKRCGRLFATPTTFAAHFRIHSKCSYTCCLCKNVFCGTEEAAAHATTHQEVCKFRREYECGVCANLGLLNELAFDAHLEQHSNEPERCTYAYMCRNCRSYFRSTATFSVHLLKCTDKGKGIAPNVRGPSLNKANNVKYVTADCEVCHNKIIYVPEKPVKTCCKCRTEQKASMKRYYCILCSKQIQYQDKISHMRLCDYARPTVILDKLPSSGDYSLSRKRKSAEENSRKKRKRHHVPRKTAEPDPIAEKPVLFNGVYTCKSCEYTSVERGDFHAHIKTHRDISTAYQCMECGECFVVKPSLYKHLMHFHNISDYQTYLEENDCYDVDAVQELEKSMKLAPGESKEPVGENQCRVCRAQFEDSNALNIHFRIHGMAFLLRNTK